jgi:hypothetical protein
LTHDDHPFDNTFGSVVRQCDDRLQLGMTDFLRRNPQLGQPALFTDINGVQTEFLYGTPTDASMDRLTMVVQAKSKPEVSRLEYR